VIRATRAAVKSRLLQLPELQGSVFHGVVTDRPERYITFFLNSGVRSPYRYTGASTRADFTVTVHSVGKTDEQVGWLQERVLGQFVDWVPELVGRKCFRLTHEVARPTDLDDSLSPPLFYAVDEFDFSTFPA
jgi:hypothetical protein